MLKGGFFWTEYAEPIDFRQRDLCMLFVKIAAGNMDLFIIKIFKVTSEFNHKSQE